MYLERGLGWPQVRWYGWVKRQRKRWRSGEWSEEEVVWIYGGEKEVTPRQLSQWARGHWEIENCVFLGVRRDLPRRPQSCAKDRRASPYHSLYGDQRYSPLICARWTQVSFCTLRSGVSLAECLLEG